MEEEIKDRKSNKQIIEEKDGKKKVIEVNTGESFADRPYHGRKHAAPKFTDDDPRIEPLKDNR